MQRPRRPIARNRGDLLIWTVVAAAIGVVAVGFLTHSVWASLSAQQNTVDFNVRQRALNAFVDRVDNQYRTVDSYFVPAIDVAGGSNPVPAPGSASPKGGAGFVPGVPAANPTAHEFDAYTKDATATAHFVAYYYDATAKTVSVVPYASRDANGNALGVNSPLAVYRNVTWFSPSSLLNTQVHLVDEHVQQRYTTRGGVAADHLYNLGFPGVIGGDLAVQVFIATSDTNPALSLGLTLKAHTNPRKESTTVVEAPLHSPMAQSAVTLTFVNPLYPAQQVLTSNANYTGPFTLNASSCQPNASVAAVGGARGPSETWIVSPVAPGQCSFSVSTVDVNRTAIVQVVVGAYSPIVASPSRIVFVNPRDTSPHGFDGGGNDLGVVTNGAANASEANDPQTIAVDSSSCAGIATIAVVSSQNGSVSTTATPTSPGDCMITFNDGHGGVTTTAVHVGAFSGLAVTPNSASFGSLGASQSSSITESAYSGTFSYNINGCAGYITINGSSATGWQTTGNGPSSSLTIGSVANVSGCTVLVSDDHNNSGGTPAGPVPVAVSVSGATPTPTPVGTATPTPAATPTPTPTATPFPGGFGTPTPSPTPLASGCTVSGQTMTMAAGGGTCVLSGHLTMAGTSTFCPVITFSCRATTVNQFGSDTQGVGVFALSYIGNVDTRSGWYCVSSSGWAGCQGITVNFGTLPNAAMPVLITYNVSNAIVSGTAATMGVNFGAFTMGAAADWRAAGEANPIAPPWPPYLSGYLTTLKTQGYESTYTAADLGASSFWITWLGEASQLGATTNASISFDYVLTVQEAPGISGGVYVNAPSLAVLQLWQ